MYLGAFHFTGSRDALLAAYGRLMAGYPEESLTLHVCVTTRDGITVYDACPSADVFAEFSTGPGFKAALTEAGLPEPRVEPIGEVTAALARQESLPLGTRQESPPLDARQESLP